MRTRSEPRTATPVQPGPGRSAVTRGRVPGRTVLLVTGLAVLPASLATTAPVVLLPSLQQSFPDADVADLSWVLNAFTIMFATSVVVLGRLADLLGRRSVLTWGLGLFTVATVLCVVAASLPALIGFRAVQGLGAAMLVSAAAAVVADGHAPARRARALAGWGAAAVLGLASGPALGGVLVTIGDWRWLFAALVPVGVASLLLARRVLVESRSPGRRRMPALVGAAAEAGALVLLTLAILRAGSDGLLGLVVILCLLGSLVLVLVAVTAARGGRSRTARAPWRSRAPGLGTVIAVTAGAGVAIQLVTALGLQQVLEWSAPATGAVLLAAVLAAGAVLAAAVGGPDREAPPDPAAAVSTSFLGAALAGGAVGTAVAVSALGRLPTADAEDLLLQVWGLGVVCVATSAVAALVLRAATRRPGPAVVDPDGEGSSGGSTARAGEPEAAPGTDARLSLPLVPKPRDGAAVAGPDLSTVPLLARLPLASRRLLVDSAPSVSLRAGEQLFAAGDPADSMYLLRSGRLEVLIDDTVVRELGPGAVLGELALLTGRPRSATVRARRDSELLRVPRRVFDEVVATEPTAGAVLSAGLAEQLHQARPTDAPAPTEPRVVAVVGLHPGAPVDAVAAHLADALGAWHVTVRPGRVDAEQLARAERDAGRVVLVAPHLGDDELWWRSCLRQADRVVLVADASCAPRATSALPPPTHAPDLVLVGPADHVAAESWVLVTAPWQVTQVTGALGPGLQALAARLASRSVGLALAGGGARAFAHVGVLAELDDADVAVDRVAGCSAGAIIGAMYASGVQGSTLTEVCYEEFVRRRPFSDYGLPLTALARGHRARAALHRRLGGLHIERLPHQFRCVSTDLNERTLVHHRSGPLAEAVLASASLPVLMPPVVLDGRLLVDGGILDNLPVAALTERAEGPIVAVHISMGGSGRPRPAGEAPRPPRVPALGETLLRTMTIGSAGAVAAARAAGALVITPPTLGVGLLEFHQLDVMVQAGRRAARTLLDAMGDDPSKWTEMLQEAGDDHPGPHPGV